MSKLTARDVMTKGVIWCRDTDKAKNAARIMESKRVRRLPVIEQEDGRHARSWRHLSRSVAEDGSQSDQGSFGSSPVRLGSGPNDARRDTQSEGLPRRSREYFAKKHGITRDQAQRLIKRSHNEAAAKLKAAIVRRAERLLNRPQTEGSYRAAGATPAAADSAYCIPTVSSLRPRQLQPYR